MGDKKHKVVFVMGCTASGKSKLSVNLAAYFPSEIVNSDKIQFYKGLDIMTNKITDSSEHHGVPHHLLGVIEDPEADLTVDDFCRFVEGSIYEIVGRGHLPIIVGGSNNYIEALVENPNTNFRSRFDCCFIWIVVLLPVLYKYIAKRVDKMVEGGLVDEAREMFVPNADYSRGIRRAIGALELDKYFKAERNGEQLYRDDLLKLAIQEIKDNTCKLALCQFQKLHRLRDELGWKLHQVDATAVYEKSGEEAVNEWMNAIVKPSRAIIKDFLEENRSKTNMKKRMRIGVLSALVTVGVGLMVNWICNGSWNGV
ncbi:adenylate isopentenyltransferase 5, chloroplastic-like [Cucurbita maxima]|uniref:adenylate dimethylallyltransferase (ADP/ATP-dependent) n=1 Tax=Cucurbita maxima TaxID=3661 RepID=A0A6J1JG07_CUCMA|nr:adenylate isopentenyltransferase 5, chloroplastic-like [Cucurbita maxima]